MLRAAAPAPIKSLHQKLWGFLRVMVEWASAGLTTRDLPRQTGPLPLQHKLNEKAQGLNTKGDGLARAALLNTHLKISSPEEI